MFEFGSGNMWAIPTHTIAGVAITYPTPVPFGAIQEGSVEISGNLKELYGQYRFPLDVAAGQSKITGKARGADINAALFNLIFGSTPATGEVKVAFEEAGSIPAVAGPYTITVTNSATWATDLGVKFTATGIPLVRVSTGPTTGQYSVAAGVYTFAAADTLLAVKISYTYTNVVAPGQVLTISNLLVGQTVNWKGVFNSQYKGKHLTLTLNRCVSSKITFGTKTEDYTIPEFDFAAMADDSNVVGTISFAHGGA
jgi:hypothetical protein